MFLFCTFKKPYNSSIKSSDNILNLPFIGIKFIFKIFSSINEKLK